ncbi:uncharacterized protein LOC144108332 [Amblyomma americanum]
MWEEAGSTLAASEQPPSSKLVQGMFSSALWRLDVLEGEQTSLPCRVDLASRRAVSAVWYRFAATDHNNHGDYSTLISNANRQPKQVYSIEAPTTPATPVLAGSAGLVDGTHWKQPQWSGRAFFSLLSNPPALLLNRLERSDTGSYVCNVTYRDDDSNATSGVSVTESRVELVVTYPLPTPVIMDHGGAVLNKTAGPYVEGDTLKLKCVARSADRKVTLQWRRNGKTLNRPLPTMHSPGGGLEIILEIGPLLREHLFLNISCVATSEASRPVESSVLLDMFLAPKDVVLWSWPHGKNVASGWVMAAASVTAAFANGVVSPTKASTLLSAQTADAAGTPGPYDLSAASRPANVHSKNYWYAGFTTPSRFECEVNGSRPQANVTWFLDGRLLDESLSHSRTEGNVTASVLLLPGLEHAGKQLECRATNGYLPEDRGVVRRYLTVNISNKTEVNIKLDTGLNANNISEGADVYMECSGVTASRVSDVTWSQDGRELGAEPAEGTVVTSRYLAIRRVDPRHSGNYTCAVTRSGGEKVESKPLHIRVRYSPRCDGAEENVISVEEGTPVNVTCNVRADPSDGLRYFWLQENGTETPWVSSDEGQLLYGKHFGRPLVTDTDSLEMVFNGSFSNATLTCWAENAVGTQRRRCRFKKARAGFHAGDAFSCLTCRVGNYTDTSFSLSCWTPVVNGTRTTFREQQRLRVEVFDARRGNRSERSFWSLGLGPILVTRLRPSVVYLVVVRMPPDASFRAYVRTLSSAHTLKKQGDLKSTAERGRWTQTMSVVVLACSLAATLVTLLSVFCACALKRRQRKPRRPLYKTGDAVATCQYEKSEAVRDHKLYHSSTGIS